jgi:hypothetical protein
MLIALGAGLTVGLIHVFTGPDHLGAIAPIASIERQRVWAIGLRWGLGHSLGVVLVCLLVGILTQLTFLDPFNSASERLIGIMLLLIAGWGFWRLFRPHRHPATSTATDSQRGRQRFTPYAIGILHGCAGGSHLVGVLLMFAFPTIAGVMTYVAGFVVGTLVAMTAFAAGIGWIATVRGHSPRLQQTVVLLSSLFSAIIGGWWLIA